MITAVRGASCSSATIYTLGNRFAQPDLHLGRLEEYARGQN